MSTKIYVDFSAMVRGHLQKIARGENHSFSSITGHSSIQLKIIIINASNNNGIRLDFNLCSINYLAPTAKSPSSIQRVTPVSAVGDFHVFMTFSPLASSYMNIQILQTFYSSNEV